MKRVVQFRHKYQLDAYVYLILKLGLGRPKSRTIMFQLADPSVARPYGVIMEVLVHVGTMIFPVNFVILDFEHDQEVSFILGHRLL